MGEMANGNLSLLFDAGQPRSLVIHFEGEDAVLIRCGKRRRVNCAVGGDG